MHLHFVVSVFEAQSAGNRNLLYAAIFHSLAGVVTGSVFQVRTLLLLLFIVLIEAAGLAVSDIRLAGFWVMTNLCLVQVGYLVGLFVRGLLEQAGYSFPPARIPRP